MKYNNKEAINCQFCENLENLAGIFYISRNGNFKRFKYTYTFTHCIFQCGFKSGREVKWNMISKNPAKLFLLQWFCIFRKISIMLWLPECDNFIEMQNAEIIQKINKNKTVKGWMFYLNRYNICLKNFIV